MNTFNNQQFVPPNNFNANSLNFNNMLGIIEPMAQFNKTGDIEDHPRFGDFMKNSSCASFYTNYKAVKNKEFEDTLKSKMEEAFAIQKEYEEWHKKCFSEIHSKFNQFLGNPNVVLDGVTNDVNNSNNNPTNDDEFNKLKKENEEMRIKQEQMAEEQAKTNALMQKLMAEKENDKPLNKGGAK